MSINNQERDTASYEAGRVAGRDTPERDAGRAQNLLQKPVTKPASDPHAAELDYWRSNYQQRSYVEPGVSYDDYAPAYRYGSESYAQNAGLGRSFDDLEPQLATKWESYRAASQLSWHQARHAARDAWVRVEGAAKGDERWVPMLKDLMQTCMDGVKGFKLAAEKANPTHAVMFARLGAERERIANALRREIELRGGEWVEKEGDARGIMHRGWINLKSALSSGDRAVVDECERGEDAAVADFQKVLNDHQLPTDLDAVLTRMYTNIKGSHDEVSALKHSMHAKE